MVCVIFFLIPPPPPPSPPPPRTSLSTVGDQQQPINSPQKSDLHIQGPTPGLSSNHGNQGLFSSFMYDFMAGNG
jgi:hypothetical protein